MASNTSEARLGAARKTLHDCLEILRRTDTATAESLREHIQQYLGASSDLERHCRQAPSRELDTPERLDEYKTKIQEDLLIFWDSHQAARSTWKSIFEQLRKSIAGVLKNDPERAWNNPEQVRTCLISALETLCEPWSGTRHCHKYPADSLDRFFRIASERRSISSDETPASREFRILINTSEQPRANAAASEAEAASEPVEPKLEFRPDGDGYFLNGFGESGHVTAIGAKGFHDLFRLVQRPSVLVPMVEFDTALGMREIAGDERSRQPVADGGTFSDIAHERKELKTQLEAATCDLERNEIETELAKLESSTRSLLGRNGRVRDMNNPLDKRRPKLLGRIRRVVSRLQKAELTELAKHFDLAVSSESGCLVYRPAVIGTIWDTSKK